MAGNASHVVLLMAVAAATAGCQETCAEQCQQKLDDCLRTARTLDQRTVCQDAGANCLNKCPTDEQPHLGESTSDGVCSSTAAWIPPRVGHARLGGYMGALSAFGDRP